MPRLDSGLTFSVPAKSVVASQVRQREHRLHVFSRMRTLPALATVAILLVGAGPPAEAVTVRDIIELLRAGLGDDVLVAVIETDQLVDRPDAQQIVELRMAGISERVIVAMLRARNDANFGRRTLAADVSRSRVPLTVIVTPTAPSSFGLPVVTVPHSGHFGLSPKRTGERHFGQFINNANDIIVEPARPATAPVYWGWGGKRRPDTWNERD